MLVENKLHREHWRLSNHPAAFIPEGRKWIKEKWGTERCVSLSLCTAFTQCCTQISRVQKYIFWKCLLLLHFQAFFNVLAEVWKIDACSYLYITYDRFLARNNLKKKKKPQRSVWWIIHQCFIDRNTFCKGCRDEWVARGLNGVCVWGGDDV